MRSLILRVVVVVVALMANAFGGGPPSTLEAMFVSHEDVPWIDFGGGIFVKFPVTDPYSGMYTVVLKSPGGRLARHRHLGSVFAITLDGSWRYEEHDWVSKNEGDFIFYLGVARCSAQPRYFGRARRNAHLFHCLRSA